MYEVLIERTAERDLTSLPADSHESPPALERWPKSKTFLPEDNRVQAGPHNVHSTKKELNVRHCQPPHSVVRSSLTRANIRS